MRVLVDGRHRVHQPRTCSAALLRAATRSPSSTAAASPIACPPASRPSPADRKDHAGLRERLARPPLRRRLRRHLRADPRRGRGRARGRPRGLAARRVRLHGARLRPRAAHPLLRGDRPGILLGRLRPSQDRRRGRAPRAPPGARAAGDHRAPDPRAWARSTPATTRRSSWTGSAAAARCSCRATAGWLRQFGHVEDLADVMVAMLGNPRAAGQAYNVMGEEMVTPGGLRRADRRGDGPAGDARATSTRRCSRASTSRARVRPEPRLRLPRGPHDAQAAPRSSASAPATPSPRDSRRPGSGIAPRAWPSARSTSPSRTSCSPRSARDRPAHPRLPRRSAGRARLRAAVRLPRGLPRGRVLDAGPGAHPPARTPRSSTLERPARACCPPAARLRWIQHMGAGVERYLASPSFRPGVRLTRAAGIFGPWMAEYTLGWCLWVTQRMDALPRPAAAAALGAGRSGAAARPHALRGRPRRHRADHREGRPGDRHAGRRGDPERPTRRARRPRLPPRRRGGRARPRRTSWS